MSTIKLSSGLVHKVPKDLSQELMKSNDTISLWEALTPIARNEFLCLIDSAKLDETKTKRIRRTIEELLDGQKRPCCWVGCIHRTDKKLSKWQQNVLIDKKEKTTRSK